MVAVVALVAFPCCVSWDGGNIISTPSATFVRILEDSGVAVQDLGIWFLDFSVSGSWHQALGFGFRSQDLEFKGMGWFRIRGLCSLESRVWGSGLRI
jgi:hypothetical protein